MTVNQYFEKWAQSFSGCDGGDIGSSSSRSIWFCGIEWGGSRSAQQIRSEFQVDLSTPPEGYGDAAHNMAYIFNRQTLKILSAVDGKKVSDYREFCGQAKPFTKGSSGYFKMNLYPIAFKNTDQSRWHSEFAEVTGFERKADYIEWCKEYRFPVMRQWAREAKPRLILCVGKDYRGDFKRAFHDETVTFSHMTIANKDLWWSVNADGTMVVIIPFMVNRNGLTKNDRADSNLKCNTRGFNE